MSHELQEVFDRREMDVHTANANARSRIAILRARQMMEMSTWMTDERISDIKQAEFNLATARFQCDLGIIQGHSRDAFYAACADLASAKTTLNELSWMAELDEYRESDEIRKAIRNYQCRKRK